VIQETHAGRDIFREVTGEYDGTISGSIFLLLPVGFPLQKLEHKVTSTRTFNNLRCYTPKVAYYFGGCLLKSLSWDLLHLLQPFMVSLQTGSKKLAGTCNTNRISEKSM
jgi:hypothetical protein